MPAHDDPAADAAFREAVRRASAARRATHEDEDWLLNIDPDDIARHIQVRDKPSFRNALSRFDAETDAMVERLREQRHAQRMRLFDDLLRDLAED